MSDVEDFVDFLFGGLTGYVYTPLKKPSGEWERNFFHYPSERDGLVAWIQTAHHDGDVYIAPALFKEKSSKKQAFKTCQVVWIEFDGQESVQFDSIPEPSATVQSSLPSHAHCYWKVDPTNPNVIEDINRRLTFYFKADSSGWDINQVLRPPETFNHKRELPTKLVDLNESKFTFEQFDILPAPPRPPIELVERLIPSYDEVTKLVTLSPVAKRLLNNPDVREPHRSSYLMRLGHTLAEEGLTDVQIVAFLLYADKRIKKFEGRDDQLLRLSEIAALAIQKVKLEEKPVAYSPLEILSLEQELDFIWGRWLHTQGLMLVTGAPSVGKTQFCLDFVAKITTGRDCVGKKTILKGPLLFFSMEMDPVELKYIFQHQVRDLDDDGRKKWAENLVVLSPDMDYGLAGIENSIDELKPSVVIIDSMSELGAEDLGEAEARRLMKWFRKIKKRYDCAIIIIHHNRKATDANKKPKKLSDLYGSYLFGAKSETVLSLWEEKNYIEVTTLKARFSVHEAINVKRTPHLTFELVNEKIKEKEVKKDVSGKPGESGPGPIMFTFG